MNLNSNGVVAGVQTMTYTTLTAGVFQIRARSTFIPPSGCTLTVSQTGSQSVSYTQGPPAANATHIEIDNMFNCASGDVLTLAITSSNPSDADYNINELKTTFSLVQRQ